MQNQGTFKNGCDPTEHAVIYNVGVHPDTCYFLGEKVRMTKAPIQVVPADSSANLKKESRIRFGKIYSIEWNVKVKDIGMVCDVDLGTLVEHHNAEMR
ncbi:hypothetical protein N0V86_001263 [Didymella sp. IMI 355093]|nr:hypothetical protein N0V86_001263 [Didymella sp. IMI 355093]